VYAQPSHISRSHWSLLLLLRPGERRADQRGRASQLDPDDAFQLGEELLVGHGASGLEVGDLHAGQGRSAFTLCNRSRGDPKSPVHVALTSCGFAFTAVARSFCVMLFPSGLSLACRACASAFPTLRRESALTTTSTTLTPTTHRPSLAALGRRHGQERRYAGGRRLQMVSTSPPPTLKRQQRDCWIPRSEGRLSPLTSFRLTGRLGPSCDSCAGPLSGY
jgi:hypothetical protein